MRAPVLLGLVLLTPAGMQAQSTGAGALAGFDAYVREAVEAWDVPGLTVAVVKDDSLVFANAYGVRSLETRAPVTLHTLFAIGSTTKAFTTMALAMLVDDGTLAWDDRVTDLLPGFVLADPYVTREMRLRDLVTHRAGFGDPSYLWYGVETGLDEMIRRLRFVEPATSFRSRYAYNNIMYATAGYIAGRANGTTWDALVRERILAPLGMDETVTQGRFIPPGADVTAPHDYVNDTLVAIPPLTLADSIPAAGAVFSNALDMSRWMRFLLRDGTVDGEPLVTPASFRELFRPQTVIPVASFYPTARLTRPHFIAYGMAWFLMDYRGEFVAFHTGSIDGMVAVVGLMPERDLGVVVLANRDHAELRHALMLRAFDAYLGGGEARDWSSDLKELYDGITAARRRRADDLASRRVTGTHPTHDLADYVGRYADSAVGAVTVRMENGGLVLSRSPFLTADLAHWHYDVFRVDWRNRWISPGQVTFRLGGDGSVAGLRLGGAEFGRVAGQH